MRIPIIAMNNIDVIIIFFSVKAKIKGWMGGFFSQSRLPQPTVPHSASEQRPSTDTISASPRLRSTATVDARGRNPLSRGPNGASEQRSSTYEPIPKFVSQRESVHFIDRRSSMTNAYSKSRHIPHPSDIEPEIQPNKGLNKWKRWIRTQHGYRKRSKSSVN